MCASSVGFERYAAVGNPLSRWSDSLAVGKTFQFYELVHYQLSIVVRDNKAFDVLLLAVFRYFDACRRIQGKYNSRVIKGPEKSRPWQSPRASPFIIFMYAAEVGIVSHWLAAC